MALIERLCDGDCKVRIKAAHKLGSRLHADFCCTPEVLNALVRALQCDTCWEVRRAAAWAIAYQGARVPQGVAALYIASKIDHHYMVRDAAATGLDILLVCRRDCFKDLFAAADALIVRVRKDYDPTHQKCVELLAQFCAQCESLCGGGAVAMPLQTAVVEQAPAPTTPGKVQLAPMPR